MKKGDGMDVYNTELDREEEVICLVYVPDHAGFVDTNRFVWFWRDGRYEGAHR